MSAESTEHALSEEIADQDESVTPDVSHAKVSGASRLEEEGDVAADYLEELLDIADIDGDIDIEVRNGRTYISIVAEEETEGLEGLVGEDGEVLEALQELTRLAVLSATETRSRLVLDINGYRQERTGHLQKIAEDAAASVKETGKPVALEPMSAYERKIVHDAVADLGLGQRVRGRRLRPPHCCFRRLENASTITMVDITAAELRAAEKIFGDRLELAKRYVEHLATSGTERGLIGPREVPRLWSRHVLNCAVIESEIAQGSHVADVGSGAGLPGLCLAIARPDLELTLIEPLERRVIWLQEVVDDLGLDNVTVMRTRAELAVGHVEADVVTARAVSALTNLAGLTIPLLAGHGEVVAIKGRSAGEEIEKAAKIIRKLGGVKTSVVTVGDNLLEEPTTVVRIVVNKSQKKS